MEDFIVSARKYRPQSFDAVVGQQSITDTLLRSVEENHLAQAFLFCGPRGVGKTTCARILAKTVNAKFADEADEKSDYAFNIFELDAASNNSVDDIRSLIDQVRVPPQTGRYKVYIIDEVHMLSTGAFNAFLKTLEEPPPYAIFILATTEKHKVLPTILSRCQIFDFNRIQVPEAVSHLRTIAEEEGIAIEDEALHVIAEKADGALRDALSIFDRMVSSSGKNVTYEAVISNLNVLDYDHYFSLTDHFLAGDRTNCLLTLNEIVNKGFDTHNFINGLSNHFRSLLFCVDAKTAAILEVGENVKRRYFEQSQKCDLRFLLNGLNILSDADTNYKSSRNQRLLTELALLKLCKIGGGASAEKKNTEPAELSTEPGPAQTPVSESEERNPSRASAREDFSGKEKTAPDATQASEPKEEEREPDQAAEPAGFSEKGNARDTAPEPAETQCSATPAAEEGDPEPNHGEREETKPSLGGNSQTSGDSRAEQTESTPRSSGFSAKLGNKRGKGIPSLGAKAKSATPKNIDSEENGSDEQHEPVSPLTGERPSEPFNLAQLWEVWDAYAETIREEDRQSYYSTLTKRKPVVREENKVELVLDNHVQLGDLEKDKINLLTHLRESLNNWKITLEGVIEEEESGDDLHLYTPEERYKAMAATNPLLSEMKRNFDLDIEHD